MKSLYTIVFSFLLVFCTTATSTAQSCNENWGTVAWSNYCQQSPIQLMNLLTDPTISLPAGGTWTGPDGVPVPSGLVDPAVQPSGIYQYTWINASNCMITAGLWVNFDPDVISGGVETYVTICSDEGIINPFEFLEGNPTPGGQWLQTNSGSPSPGFAGFYLTWNPSITITQNCTFTYAIGSPPCPVYYTDLHITYLSGDNTTSQVTTCLPYEWNGTTYTEPGTYVQTLSQSGNCEETATLVLSEYSGGSITVSSSQQICLGGINPTQFTASVAGAAGENRLWYITPSGNTNIIAMTFSEPSFNWNLVPPGNYRLWHVSYADGASIYGMSDAVQFDGCHNISAPAEIEVVLWSAGVIGTGDNTSICLNAGPVGINATVSGSTAPFGKWVLADTDNNILGLGSSTSNFNLAVLDPGNYRIYYAGSGDANDLTGLGNLNNAPACVYLSNPINIQASNCFGNVEWAAVQESATLNSTPNPNWGIAQVYFQLDETLPATLEVYDSSGKLVKAIFTGVAEKDTEYRFEFGSAGLPAGLYLYRLQTPHDLKISKFIIP